MAQDFLLEHRLRLEQRSYQLRELIGPLQVELDLVRQELELLDRLRDLEARRGEDPATAETATVAVEQPAGRPDDGSDRRKSTLNELMISVFQDAGAPLHRRELVVLTQERARRSERVVPSAQTIITRLSRDPAFVPLRAKALMRGYWRLVEWATDRAPRHVGSDYVGALDALDGQLRMWRFQRRNADQTQARINAMPPGPERMPLERRLEHIRQMVANRARRVPMQVDRAAALRELLGDLAPMYPPVPDLAELREELAEDARRGGGLLT